MSRSKRERQMPLPGMREQQALDAVLHETLSDICLFCERASGITLRSYQRQVAYAVVDSVLRGKGLSLVVVFPRQSGKNELQAQIETYLLCLLSPLDAEMVKVSPTWKPQSLNAMRRLERVLKRNLIARALQFTRESGYIYRLGGARLTFLSGAPGANVVGATASTLLQCDEAQDVDIAKWDREISPMAASTNATRVFWGTAWTADTLLGREMRLAEAAQQRDGVQRVFRIGADQVIAEVPAYGRFVAEEIARLGRMHPFIRTQYYSEEIDALGGMFPPGRLALMQGAHPPQDSPQAEGVYAFLLDVAGEAGGETPSGAPPLAQRDASALTIVQVDLSTLEDEHIQAPTYRVAARHLWQGEAHSTLYSRIRSLADTWKPQRIIVDATGIGAGLASFLAKALPGRVRQFIFTQKSKSDLGWRFIALVETGRYLEYSPPEGRADGLQALFWEQAGRARMEVLPGAGRTLRWGVPEGARRPLDGSPLHDDLLVSASLCALLDEESWGQARSGVIPAPDPLQGLRFED